SMHRVLMHSWSGLLPRPWHALRLSRPGGRPSTTGQAARCPSCRRVRTIRRKTMWPDKEAYEYVKITIPGVGLTPGTCVWAPGPCRWSNLLSTGMYPMDVEGTQIGSVRPKGDESMRSPMRVIVLILALLLGACSNRN